MIIEYNIRTHGLMFRWESSLDYLETRWSREHKIFAWLKIKILVICEIVQAEIVCMYA